MERLMTSLLYFSFGFSVCGLTNGVKFTPINAIVAFGGPALALLLLVYVLEKK